MDTSPALAPLLSPAGTLVVGPKPIEQRRRVTLATLGKAAVEVAKHSVGPLLIGVALSLASSYTGVTDEIRAAATPFLPISAPAERLHWAPLPTSPFIEVGRKEDGGLSIQGLMEGWKHAGLPNAAFDDVRLLVTPLMPTLLGREDPFLEAQLVEEAHAANAQLKAQYPQVWERLSSGQAVVLSPEEEQAWERLYLSREASFYADPEIEGPRHSLEARAAVMASEADPSIGLFLTPGLNPDGSYDAEQMLKAWQRVGVDTRRAVLLMDLLDEAMPVMAGETASVQQARLIRASQALDALDAEFKDSLAALRQGRSIPLTADQQRAWENEGEFLLEDFRDGQGFATEEVSWAQAKEHLAKSVQESGLRSLTVAWSDWASPRQLKERARFIEQANQELQAVSGWPGQVLGLSGRVELTLGTPQAVPGAGGITSRNQAGRLQIVTEQGALAHEWFHALDYAAAAKVLKRPNHDTLSENLQWLRQANDPQARAAWKQHYSQVMDAAPAWQRDRSRAGNPGYWMSPSEGMAFAFAAQFEERPGSVLRDPGLATAGLLDPQRLPNARERTQQAPAFEALFDAMKGQRLSVETPSVEEWRRLRQKTVEEQPLALKRGVTYR